MLPNVLPISQIRKGIAASHSLNHPNLEQTWQLSAETTKHYDPDHPVLESLATRSYVTKPFTSLAGLGNQIPGDEPRKTEQVLKPQLACLIRHMQSTYTIFV